MSKPDHLRIKDTTGTWADLSRWLIKGGAAVDARWFYRDATDETWQAIVEGRLAFVEATRDYCNLQVTLGKAPATIRGHTDCVNEFMQWVDQENITLSMDDKTLVSIFLQYDEFVYHKAWGKKEIQPSTAYQTMARFSQVLSWILKRPDHLALKHDSRSLKACKHPRKTSISRNAEKQHFGDTQALGYHCVDLTDALTIESIYGQLPIVFSSTQPDGTALPISIMPNGYRNALADKPPKKSAAWARKMCAPTTDVDRYRGSLIKLRILAELVVFVYQTGMNISPILQIERRGFKYKAQGNSDWRVTALKGRRHGPVGFTIYKEYRERFKRYIEFVEHFYPDDPFLFPLGSEGEKQKGAVAYSGLKKHLMVHGIAWIPPQVTRNTRANFLNRMAGDPNVSDEMNQHTRETFKQNYERPSQQRAMSALTHFWKEEPISLINSGCDAQPEATPDKPSDVISPNCINESGCLWCKSHRDIESEDYVWSLASFRHLKKIEAAQPIKRDVPAEHVIARVSDKLTAFKERNEQSLSWVEEALLRIEEGVYHPTWKNVINFWENT